MKLAFCFLSYDDIEQHETWNSFFKDVSPEKYTVLVHMKNRTDTSIIQGALVIPTIPTEWGGFSLVKVQQALIEAAFEDEAVTKFILLSGDSIPLYRFDTIYEQLYKDDKGYLAINVRTRGQERVQAINRGAWPRTMPWKWIKSSQWSILNRVHVQLLHEHFDTLTQVFSNSSIPDEHLYPVFFNGCNISNTFHNKPSMFVNWSRSIYSCSVPHHITPATYHTIELNAANINEIYNSGAFFLRKICKTAKVRMEWDAERPLQIVSSSNAPTFISIKTTRMPKLFKKTI